MSFAFDSPPADAFGSAQAAIFLRIDDLTGQFQNSPIAAELTEAWARCMQSNGYDFGTPAEAQQFYTAAAQVPSEEERDARTTDLACDVEVGLTQGQSQFEAGTIQVWIDSHAQDVAEIETLLAAAERDVSRLRGLLTAEGAQALPSGPIVKGSTESVPPADSIEK